MVAGAEVAGAQMGVAARTKAKLTVEVEPRKEGEEATAPAAMSADGPAAGPADVAPRRSERSRLSGASPAEALRRQALAQSAQSHGFAAPDEDAGRMSTQMIDPSGAGVPGSTGL